MAQTFKYKSINVIKQSLRTQVHSTKSAVKETCSVSLRLLGLTCGAGLVVGKQLFKSDKIAHCEAKLKTRFNDETQTQPKFDWKKFGHLLKPHWWLLVIAVSVLLT